MLKCLCFGYFTKSLMQRIIKLMYGAGEYATIFTVLFFSAHRCAIAVENNYTISIDKTFDISSITRDWIELGEFPYPKAASNNETHFRCTKGAGKGLCAHTEFRVNGGLQSNPAAYWKGWMRMEPKEVNIGDGEKLIFSAYWKGSPSIRWEETNRKNMKSFFHQYTIGVASIGSSAGSITKWSSGEQGPSLRCGDLGGCTIDTHTYFDNRSGGALKLAVKLPAAFRKGTYTFSNVEVLDLGHTARNASGTTQQSVSAKVYISGKITVPERCYIDTGSGSEIKFNDVSAGASNGEIDKRSFTLKTTCKYINLKLNQYIKVNGSNGLSEYEIFSRDNSNEKALALVMRIVRGDNGEDFYANCEPDHSGRVYFSKEYLLREINGNGLNIHTYNDIIRFSLCKYGIPKDYGEKIIPLTIVSRWSDS
ncbi:TPA: FasG [Escherichia coli]|nr:FasG [Escherichia coli]